MVNVTDGKIIRPLAEDEPMDLRYGRTEEHERTLDFRTGTLRRPPCGPLPPDTPCGSSPSAWCRSPRHHRRHPLRGGADRRGHEAGACSPTLLANEPVPTPGNDPRLAAALDAPLVADLAACRNYWSILVHYTKNSNLHMAAGMDYEIDFRTSSTRSSAPTATWPGSPPPPTCRRAPSCR